MAEPNPHPVAPARGAVAGARKDANAKYNPVGTGTSWSHNFLNQKPWHPLNFRNQVRKYEAETKFLSDKKAKELAETEFRAEQERAQTMAFLSEAERKRWQDRQSIAFMYVKPPGLEAALARDKDTAAKQPALPQEQQQHQLQDPPPPPAAPAGAAPPAAVDAQRAAQAERAQALDRLREDPFAAMLAARAALANNERWVLKHATGLGQSPPRGGLAADADNQRLLAEEAEAEEGAAVVAGPAPVQEQDGADLLLASLSEKDRRAVLKALDKRRRKAEEAEKLARAHEVLRAAGVDPDAAEQRAEGDRERHSGKHKRDKSGKKDKGRKEKKERRDKRARWRSGSDSGSHSDRSDGGGQRRHRPRSPRR